MYGWGILPMIDVVVVPLLVVEAACSVDACLPEAFGNLVELRAGYAADVEEVVAVRLVQYFHDVCGIQFAGEVEVHLQQVAVGIMDFASGTDYGQAVGLQAEVAETHLEQVDAVEAHTEKENRQSDTCPSPDVQGIESHTEAENEQHEIPEHIERHAAVDGCSSRPCAAFRAGRMVVESDTPAYQCAYQSRRVVAQMDNPYFLFTRLQPQGQDAGTINVGRAVSVGFGRMSRHEAEAGYLFR